MSLNDHQMNSHEQYARSNSLCWACRLDEEQRRRPGVFTRELAAGRSPNSPSFNIRCSIILVAVSIGASVAQCCAKMHENRMFGTSSGQHKLSVPSTREVGVEDRPCLTDLWLRRGNDEQASCAQRWITLVYVGQLANQDYILRAG